MSQYDREQVQRNYDYQLEFGNPRAIARRQAWILFRREIGELSLVEKKTLGRSVATLIASEGIYEAARLSLPQSAPELPIFFKSLQSLD